MKKNVRVSQIHSNGRRITDEVHVVPAGGKLLPQLRGHHARAAVRRITSDANTHRDILNRNEIEHFASITCGCYSPHACVKDSSLPRVPTWPEYPIRRSRGRERDTR